MAVLTAIVLLSVGLLAHANAQPSTSGTRFEGFSYASNVIGYVNMTMDYCDVEAAIKTGNFTAALQIYSTGKNSFSGLSRRSFARFASYPADEAEPLHAALAMGRNDTWLDAMIRDALAKKNGPLALGLMQVSMMKYGVHEVDEAANKVAQYVANPSPENAILISNESGAPHSVDEAWALWSGGSTKNCGTLSGWAARLGADLETTFLGRSFINTGMTLVFNELLASSQMANSTAYNASRTSLQRHLTMLGLQGVMHSAYRAHAAAACKRPAAEVEEAKSMIAVHWSYLQPLLVARGSDAMNIRALQVALTASKPDYGKALSAIKIVTWGMGRRMAEVGVPKFERVTAGWNCNPSAMSQYSK